MSCLIRLFFWILQQWDYKLQINLGSSMKQRKSGGLSISKHSRHYDTFEDQLIIRRKHGHKGEIHSILELRINNFAFVFYVRSTKRTCYGIRKVTEPLSSEGCLEYSTVSAISWWMVMALKKHFPSLKKKINNPLRMEESPSKSR